MSNEEIAMGARAIKNEALAGQYPGPLVAALALMVEKLAEARRDDCDKVMARVKQGEDRFWWRLKAIEARVDGSLPACLETEVPPQVAPAREAAAPLLAETTETKAFAARVAAELDRIAERNEGLMSETPRLERERLRERALCFHEAAATVRREAGL